MKLVPFKFDGSLVRVIDRDGEPWFVANDVCSVLGISDARQALDKLDPDEKGGCSVPTPSGIQEMRAVTESGLYTLVLRARDAVTPGTVSHRFRKWVTAEVLPSIRKTGAYSTMETPAFLADPDWLRGALLTYTEKVIALEAKVSEQAPVVAAYDRIAVSHGSLCITDAAKTLQVQPHDLFRHLRVNGWIYRRAGGAADIAYQSKIISGLLEHKTTTVQRTDGTEKTASQVRITPKGLARLAEELTPKLAL